MYDEAVGNGSEARNTPPVTPNWRWKKRNNRKKPQAQDSENQAMTDDVALANTNWNALNPTRKHKKRNTKRRTDENTNDEAAGTVKDDSKMIEDDSKLIKDDSKTIKDDNKVNDDSKVIKGDSKVIIKDDSKRIELNKRNQKKFGRKTSKELQVAVPDLEPGQKFVFEQNHIHPLSKMYSKNPYAVFQCKLCKYYCDNVGIVEHHIQDRRHLRALEENEEKFTIMNIPPPTPSQLKILNELLETHIKNYGLSDFDLRVRANIATTLNDSLADVLPGFTVRMYGSSATGIAMKKSDLNLELCVPSEQSAPKGLAAVYDFIFKQNDKYHDVKSDFSAEIPAVRFVSNEANVQCALILSYSHSFKIAELLKKYVSIDKRAQQLGIIFRIWAHCCKLDNTDMCMLPPYAFSLLVVYFLQQLPSPVLPVLHELVESQSDEKNPEIYLEPEDLKEKWTSQNEMSLAELWLQLFKFYSVDFDFMHDVVCIEQHERLRRKENARRWMGKKMAIRDPFMPKRNVARSMATQSGIDYIMTCFRKTYKYYAIPETETGPIFARIGKEMIGDHEIYRRVTEANESLIKELLEGHHYFTKPQRAPTTVAELEKQLFSRAQNSLNSVLPSLVVPLRWAHEMFTRFNENYFYYQFEPRVFIGNQIIPEICSSCQKDGHLKEDCQEELVDKFDVTLPPMEDYYMDALDRVCQEVLERWETPESEMQKRYAIVAEIEEYLKQFYPTAKLELFGSSCNGFGLLKSDVDICLTFTDSVDGKEHDFVKLIEVMQEKLKIFGPLQNLVSITTAKVPILKFSHVRSELDGDISIYNTLGKQNTKLLRTYAEIDTRVKMLGNMIKRFAKVCDMCDASRGSLSSYAYIIMLIYFLQQCDPPVLPVLQELPETEPRPEVIVEDCNTYFYNDVDNLKNVWPEFGKNTFSVGELWLKLLGFYSAEFDFTTFVITIRKKEPLLRFEKLWTSKCMAIEDPFDLSHNLGAGLSRKMHCYIVKSFRKAYLHFGICKPDVLNHNGPLEHYFFRSENLTIGDPPNDRGCRLCKKIGHLCKDCPQKKQNQPKMQQGRPLKRTNFAGPAMNRNIPCNTVPAQVQSYSPAHTKGQRPHPPGTKFRSPNITPYRSFQMQENSGIRYGSQHTLPPFRSSGSPEKCDKKNSVGNHPPFMAPPGSMNIRPHLAVYNGQRQLNNASPQAVESPQRSEDQRLQECQFMTQRMTLCPEENARNTSPLKSSDRFPHGPS